MSEHCKQDGGFIGDAGCTHPNHQHSELVKGLLADSAHMITAQDAEAALREGFYVSNPNGKRVGFGSGLLKHINNDPNHAPEDADERKKRLLFAVDTVKHPDRMDVNHRGIEGRTAYAKAFEDFGILAITGPESDTIDKVYTFFPRRGGKLRR